MRNFLIWFFEPLYLRLTDWMGDNGLILYGGGKGDAPDAPDYTPLANASEKAAQIGAELGREQLAETKRQYDDTMKVSQPVIDAQLGLMHQTKAQGDDYYNYMVSRQRPVEDQLNAESMHSGTQAEQDEFAARAQADALSGYTRALNIAARQGARYGFAPSNIAAQAGQQAGSMAQMQAAAANAGRQQSRDLGWARKMDVSGLYRGLPGASQGAYGLAINSGNAAVGNRQGMGNMMLSGMAQGAGMQQTGMGQQIQGLGQVLNTQANVYNTQAQAASASQQGGNQMLVAGIGAAATMI